ncbi:MAG TPA: adenylate/guanylate cyclase domain-containing protein [Chloroflexota bacterium]|nr:adenylate/guanylate cyclase domain-containing protein [Chloroflexota bacterium]
MATALRLPGTLFQHFDGLRRRRLALLRGGARQLLDATEWEVERVLHVGRFVLWTGLLALLVFVLGASPGSMMASLLSVGLSAVTGQSVTLRVEPGSAVYWLAIVGIFAGGGLAWLAYWLILARSGAWRWLRFLVIAIDVLSLLRFAVAARAAAITGVDAGISSTVLASIVPAVLVLHVLSGAVRVNPFTAGASGVTALLGQIATAALLELPPVQAGTQLGVLILTNFLAMNLVFILRGMALKAAQEGVLERFVPEGLTQRIATAGGTVPARVVPVTILIADIRGFTTISEPLGPTEAVALLNGFFATMVGPLAAEGAVLDKYLGDGLLAFVEGEQHAARGLRAARTIVRAVEESNRDRPQPIRMGIAVHSAEAFVGSIGAPARMEYTIIGDAVNVTSRLEGLMSSKAGAERIPASLVVSEDSVRAAARDGLTLPELQGPVQVAVHGRAQPLDVYYLPA